MDFFSKFHHADLVFGPVDRPGFVFIADDHGAEMMESNLSSFTTYLDVVLACWGTERMPMYHVSQYRKPKEFHTVKSRLKLDKVVAQAERER